MYRVVFCPNEAMMPEAEEMAGKAMLPILVGRNGRLDGVVFNDSVVSVVEVPVDKALIYDREIPRVGMTGRIEYRNDFADLSNDTRLVVFRPDGKSKDEFPPVMTEKHMVVFAFRGMEPGDHSFSVLVGEEEMDNGGFFVHG